MSPAVSLLLDDLFKDTVAVFYYFVVNLVVEILCRNCVAHFRFKSAFNGCFRDEAVGRGEFAAQYSKMALVKH